MFKVKALVRFSSMTEGHRKRNEEWTTTRDNAYKLQAQGVVQILEGDSKGENFETHAAPQSSSHLDPLHSAHSEAQMRGVIGQPSRSTTHGGVITSQPPSTPPTGDGGQPSTNLPDSLTSGSSETSSAEASGPATNQQLENTESTLSALSAPADSVPPKASSGRAGRSGTAARKR